MVITQLCYFFNRISQKVIDEDELQDLKEFIAETMAQLEMCFPPGYFDITEHLMIHIVDQIQALGPLYLHEMWTHEYFMSHCRKSQVCRVPAALPSAQYGTFGKYNLCQVHNEKHSANL